MELSITELRAQKRPLWMSYLGVENYADLIGSGGNIWFDRLPLQGERAEGEEIEDDEAGEGMGTSRNSAGHKPN